MCSVNGCEREECARGLCRKHYDMVRNYGRIVSATRWRLCFVCGSWFELRRSQHEFCSTACRVRYLRLKRKGMAPRRGLNQIHEIGGPYEQLAQSLSAPVASQAAFSDVDVFDASDGVCLECGGLVDRNERFRTGWLVPLEAGGESVLSNRVVLHWDCKARWEARSVNGRRWKARHKSHG